MDTATFEGQRSSGTQPASVDGDDRASYRHFLGREFRLGRLIQIGVVWAQFALVVIAFRLLNLETTAFENVATLALGGAVLHHYLPHAWKMSFFAALSLASVFLVLGWFHGAWLVGVGLGLIGLCHLPIAFGARVALLLVAGGGLVAARGVWLPLPQESAIPAAIWPIFGSMFMFRLIAYCYDLKHQASTFSPSRAIGYFFMLPNVCFSLFPVVDYKSMQRSWYDGEALQIYQSGVKWMARGLIQLLIYRWIYYKGIVEPTLIVDGLDAARYVLMTYLLYLKVSGLFHVIIGMLHMFGFGLPETHHLYLFSSSFTDFWRRINIYWKDFIQKVIFTPVYFRFRTLGHERAMAVSTLVAFAMTWFFHSYQVFWIRGDFPVVWSDLVFWFGLGVVVLINVILESRRGRVRSLKKPVQTLRGDAILALKIAATFASICVLWTVWSTPEFEVLHLILKGFMQSSATDMALIVGVPLAIGVAGATLGRRQRETSGAATATVRSRHDYWIQPVMVSGSMVALIAITLRPGLLLPISSSAAQLVRDIREGRLSEADRNRLQRGYYEDIGDPTRFSAELWEIYGQRPADWGTAEDQTRVRDDVIQREYMPSTSENFKGAVRTINSLGLRDREYSAAKLEGVYRIGLIGSSHDAGSGVGDAETYENLVEDRLNRELTPRTGIRYEVLNFSVGGYAPYQKLATIERKMLAFQPDLIVYSAHGGEFRWVPRNLERVIREKMLDEVSYIAEAIESSGVLTDSGGSAPNAMVIEAALAPYAETIMSAILRRLSECAASHGARAGLLLLEVPDDHERPQAFGVLSRIAGEVGLPVLDTSGAFASIKDRKKLWIAPWDSHTNALGHRLMADRVYTLLLEHGLVPQGDQ